MKRYLAVAAMMFAASVLAATVTLPDIPIDTSLLKLSPQEKAAFCGTTPTAPPTCPDPGTGTGNPGTADPGGGGAWNGTCSRTETDISGAPKTVQVPTRLLTLDWNNPKRLYTRDYGGMAYGDIVVAKFTTGNVGTTNSIVAVRAAEYDSPSSSRLGVLSDTPCDFTKRPGAYSEGGVGVAFAIKPGSGFGFYPVLEQNKTYYVNIMNDGGSCISATTCNMFVDLVKPGGL